MLTYLAVKNVSVIESVSLEFDGGLTVLTGETGSGKSVLLGALKLLLGDRFQKNMLREGADKLMVEGIFTDTAGIPESIKEQFDIDDELIIRREVDESGKNRIYINGRAATVGQLKEFAPYLADIHGQHEHQALLDESRHLGFIDHLVPADIKKDYAEAFARYRDKKSQYENLLADIEDMKKYQEIISYQLREIESAEIDLTEDLVLDDKINFLSYIEKIRELCGVSLDCLSDGDINASGLISKSLKTVESGEKYLPELRTVVAGLNEALDRINEASRYLTSLYERQDASPQELDSLLQRKYMLNDLVSKYGADLDGNLSLENVKIKGEVLKTRIDTFENSDAALSKLKLECDKLYAYADKMADILLTHRKQVADKIAVQVQEILVDLELPNSIFLTKFNKRAALDFSGGVDARFYLSVNVGFEPAPLAQVASGGEISRVMLALKQVFSVSDPVQTLFFDEIDTGISGRTAKKVAVKLEELGKTKQVLVITHLPVVAAAGNEHFYISKSADSGVTKTTIVKLSGQERRSSIAAMIAGEVTPSSLQQASELLERNINN